MQRSDSVVLHPWLQFGDFLKASMAPADYARLLPPLEALVKEYGMDPVRISP